MSSPRTTGKHSVKLLARSDMQNMLTWKAHLMHMQTRLIMLPCAQRARGLHTKAIKQLGVQINKKTNKTQYNHKLQILKKEITRFLKNVSHHHPMLYTCL